MLRDFQEKSLIFKITFPGPGKVCEWAKSQKLQENSGNLSNNQSNVIADVHKPCILGVTNCSMIQVLRRRSILMVESSIAQNELWNNLVRVMLHFAVHLACQLLLDGCGSAVKCIESYNGLATWVSLAAEPASNWHQAKFDKLTSWQQIFTRI